MKKTKFNEEQIIGVLNKAKPIATIIDLARRHDVAQANIHN